jgi:hypothetical protein
MGGDLDFVDSRYTFSIEGSNLLNAIVPTTASLSSLFPVGKDTVDVLDGKLTVTQGSTGSNVKLNDICIYPLYRYAPKGKFELNFGLKSASHYYHDNGELFQKKTIIPYKYGWLADIKAQLRCRTTTPDMLLNNLVQMQSGTWEIEVPNGTYKVVLLGGDPDYVNSIYTFNVEGTQVGNAFVPTAARRWFSDTTMVNVADGRLTISAGTGSSNLKLNALSITPLSMASQNIIFSALNGATIGDKDVLLSATVTSGLDVSFSSSDETIAKIVNGKIRFVGVGTCLIYANQSGNAFYSAALQVQQTLNVKEASTDVKTFNQQGLGLKVFQNSSFNKLSLESEFSLKSTEIINSLGQKMLLKAFSVQDKKLSYDFSSLASGVYFIKVRTEKKELPTIRFVKK